MNRVITPALGSGSSVCNPIYLAYLLTDYKSKVLFTPYVLVFVIVSEEQLTVYYNFTFYAVNVMANL